MSHFCAQFGGPLPCCAVEGVQFFPFLFPVSSPSTLLLPCVSLCLFFDVAVGPIRLFFKCHPRIPVCPGLPLLPLYTARCATPHLCLSRGSLACHDVPLHCFSPTLTFRCTVPTLKRFACVAPRGGKTHGACSLGGCPCLSVHPGGLCINGWGLTKIWPFLPFSQIWCGNFT